MFATLRVETIANSAGGTAQVSIVAQPCIGFLNTKYYSNALLQKTLKTAQAESLSAERLNPSWFKNPFYVNPRTYT